MPIELLRLQPFYLLLNIVHINIYFKFKKTNPLAIIGGYALVFISYVLQLTTIQDINNIVITMAIFSVQFFFIAFIYHRFMYDQKFYVVLFGILVSIVAGSLVTMVWLLIVFSFIGLPYYGTNITIVGTISVVSYALCLIPIKKYLKKPMVKLLNGLSEQKPILSVLMSLFTIHLTKGVQEIIATDPCNIKYINVCVCFILESLVVFYLFYTVIMQKNMERQFLAQLDSTEKMLGLHRFYDQQLLDREDKTRRNIHDFRHILANISAHAAKTKNNELKSIIAEISDTFDSDITFNHYCDNPAINAVFCYYASVAGKNSTALDIKISLPSQTFIRESELLIAIGNAMENCIKATQALGDKGYIKVRCKLIGNTLALKFINNFDDNYKRGQSLGLISIKQLCDKYAGSVEIEKNDNEFVLGVVINNDSVDVNQIEKKQ